MPIAVNSSISSAQRMLEIVQQEAGLVKEIQEAPTLYKSIPVFDRMNMMRTQLVTSMWRKIGRQVLAIHPEIVEEVKVATSDKVPTEILRVLPYMNPMIVFSEPVLFDSWSSDILASSGGRYAESKMRLLGLFTAGTTKAPTLTLQGQQGTEFRVFPTTATEADTFTMVLVFEILDEYGKVVDTELDTMSFKYDVTDTLGGIVETALQTYRWFRDPDQNVTTMADIVGEKAAAETKRHRRWMRDVMSTLIGSLFYLCSTTLEAEQVPAKYVAKRIPKSVVKTPLSFYKVGWTTGSALSRYRQARTNSTSQQDDLSHQQDPQHRRAHFKMQPYGPNKALRKLIFVSAYWTHVERLGDAGINTARKVTRTTKGDARESLDAVLGMAALPVEVQ